MYAIPHKAVTLPTPHPLESRPALVLAHPGHELRIHGWLERHRPVVFVLTDGSGGGGQSRLESTRRVCRRAGAREGSVFGRFADRDLYAAMMGGDTRVIVSLADELAAALIAAACDPIVCDAREGYNSAHDLCWYVVEAAVALASRARARPLTTLEFALAGPPGQLPAGAPAATVQLTLDSEAFARKMSAAMAYPEMAGEVRAALDRYSADAFRLEYLWPARHGIDGEHLAGAVPFYETYGERQVAAGVYPAVLREREHMRPLVGALRRHVHERLACRPPSPSC
jgi:hypothetical protein